MKKLSLLLIVFLALAFPIYSQSVQWGYRILEYSSQKSSKEFAAVQALGKPNVLPASGENIKAWQPKPNEKENYIKIGFLTPIKPKQIVIAESSSPGHITKIYVYDAAGKEYEIANPKKATTSLSRFLHISTSQLSFYVLAVKIVLENNNTAVAIDAIGITESDKPYKIKINPNDAVKANMVATPLSTLVNSTYPEMGPLVSPDGKTLYFSRSGDPENAGGKKDQEDIWFAQWDETTQKWGQAQNIGAPLNNSDPNFVNSISPDGNTILLGNSYLPDGSMEDGVSMSQRTATGWDTPKRLIIEDDKNSSKMTNYFLSNSQKILIISNDRKEDSNGERDLYVSFPKTDNTWTKPLNLGKTINTKATEAAPFLAADDKTLYYTSDGLDGYGGSDIYMSRRLDETWQNWSTPENLGPVVNSSHDESYFTLNASGDKVYFTSQVEKDYNDVDMYKLVLPKSLRPLPVMFVSGRVLNSKTKEPVPGVKIFFENLATSKEAGIASSSYNAGYYQLVLPSGSNYGYLAEKEGYISVNSNIDLTTMEDYKEYKQDLYITPIEIGQAIVLNNIFFVFDKYDLKKESSLELDRLVVILKNNSTMKIEISANTDNVGSEAYNDNLSIKRAESVANYLITKSGIDKSRIAMKHFGELKPVATNTTDAGRKLNRRVEFTIISK
jgi:outer membrane protein OmpA-like peptidoglycan-associated protein